MTSFSKMGSTERHTQSRVGLCLILVVIGSLVVCIPRFEVRKSSIWRKFAEWRATREFVEWRGTSEYSNTFRELESISKLARDQGDIPEVSARALVRFMHHRVWVVRQEAAFIARLSSSRESKAVLRPQILELLHDDISSVRWEAVRVLRDVGDPSAIPNLELLLRDPSKDVAFEVYQTISVIESKAATDSAK